TGLGLSIVHGIVTQSGGYVSVYSELGRGTTFRVFLPRIPESVASAVEASGAAAGPRGGSEVGLLVEEEGAGRRLARKLLDRAGYAVMEAANPTQAEEAFDGADGRIDLLMTDVVMPGGKGTDLYLRLAERKPSLRVLFMSGYTGDTAFDRRQFGGDAA